MYGREKLEAQTICAYGGDGEMYEKEDADKVMDAMERRIARLTALVEGWKRNSVELSNAYRKRLAMEHDRIKELEKSNDVLNAEYDLLKSASEEKIKELESQLPKWISVKDRLPNEKEQYKLLWVAHVRMDNTIKYMYEASFDCETKEFYTENDWGDKTFVSPAIWMVVPPPPTTEESSATEKEK